MEYKTVVVKEEPEKTNVSFPLPEPIKPLFGKPIDSIACNSVTINHLELANKINTICSEYAQEGYKLLSCLPIQEGFYNYDHSSSMESGYGYGYGLSCTTGVILTFER